MRYAEIVMIQGEEGRELTDALYAVEGVVVHGATAETIAAAIEHLTQWESGDEPEYDDEEVPLPWGTDDDIWVEGGYVLGAHRGLGYISLARVLDFTIRTTPQQMIGHGPTGYIEATVVHEPSGRVVTRESAGNEGRAIALASQRLDEMIHERIAEKRR